MITSGFLFMVGVALFFLVAIVIIVVIIVGCALLFFLSDESSKKREKLSEKEKIEAKKRSDRNDTIGTVIFFTVVSVIVAIGQIYWGWR